MKKLLLATTMMVGTAGFAAAEVSLAGSARMGLQYTEGRAQDTVMEYRTRINLTGSGETDSGLSYSATIRLQDSSTVATTNAIGVTVSGAFGSLTFGSESSAAEYAVGDLAGVGYGPSTGGADTKFIVGAFALYSYTAGDFTAYASSGQLGSDDVSIGGKYTTGGLTVGVGYEDDGSKSHIVGSAAYSMGDTTLKAVYGTAADIDFTQMGVSVAHKMGAVSVSAYYRTAETGSSSADNYGVGAAYDLGGGAALKGGFQSINEKSEADIGLTFAF